MRRQFGDLQNLPQDLRILRSPNYLHMGFRQSHDHVLQILFHTIVSSVMSSARSIGLFSDRLQMQPAVPLKFDWMILISHVNLELLPV